MTLVTTTIVTWNSRPFIEKCLASVFAQTHWETEVLVVDNGSCDGTPELVAEHYPQVILIRNNENTGFSHAQNMGIRQARGAYVLPLNPDVTLTPTYIAEMLKVAESDSRIGIVAGKLYLVGSENTLDSTGMVIFKHRRHTIRGHGQKDVGQYDRVEPVFGACGAAPFLRRAMLEDIKIGDEYFDEDFFAHKEDLDLSWRAQLYGWRCIYTPNTVAYHVRSFTPRKREQMSAEIRFHAVKNRYLVMVKNELPALFLRHLPNILWYDLKILGYLLLFERSSLKAIPAVLALLPRMLAKRRIIMSRRRVSTDYMREWFV